MSTYLVKAIIILVRHPQQKGSGSGLRHPIPPHLLRCPVLAVWFFSVPTKISISLQEEKVTALSNINKGVRHCLRAQPLVSYPFPSYNRIDTPAKQCVVSALFLLVPTPIRALMRPLAHLNPARRSQSHHGWYRAPREHLLSSTRKYPQFNMTLIMALMPVLAWTRCCWNHSLPGRKAVSDEGKRSRLQGLPGASPYPRDTARICRHLPRPVPYCWNVLCVSIFCCRSTSLC